MDGKEIINKYITSIKIKILKHKIDSQVEWHNVNL